MELPHHNEEFQNYSYSYLRYAEVHMLAVELQAECMPSYKQFISQDDTHNKKISTVILRVPICFAVLCYHIQQSSESAVPLFSMCTLKF